MVTVTPASPAGPTAPAPQVKVSTKQVALEEALAAVKAVAANHSGSAIAAQIRDQRAAAAQERLGRAQERYKLLHQTMMKVLAAGGDPRSALRLAREAASLAREVARAVKDIAAAAKGGDPASADARRSMLDGVHKESRKLLYGVRNIVDAARIVNDSGEGGVQQSRRAKDIGKARRDAEDALLGIARELGMARFAIGGSVKVEA
jgi:hypothetical protein